MTAKFVQEGDAVYVVLPLEVLDAAGLAVGQRVSIGVSDQSITMSGVDDEPVDPSLAEQVSTVHEEALELFGGDRVAARKWMYRSNRALGNQSPKKLLTSEAGIQEVRALIAQLMRGLYG